MIQANELRIGNYFKLLERICIVRAIFISHFICDDLSGITLGNSLQVNFQPIPLTPEILEKCGWAWNEECKSFEGNDARMNLSKSDINGGWTMFNYVLKAKISNQIFYLHQLQNLYFALTGQELLVNL